MNLTKKLLKFIILFTLIISLILCVILIQNIALADNSDNCNYENLNKISRQTYSITFNDYTKDTNLESLDNNFLFGCSAVRNKNFVGRNYDTSPNKIPLFAVQMKANNDRYSSVAICQNYNLTIDEIGNAPDNKKINLIPNNVLDGINEKGVSVVANYVSAQDTEKNTGTNPDGEKLNVFHIARFILDNAKDAEDALKLLQQKNIYNENQNTTLHFMISDKSSTFILEIINNQIVYATKEGKEQVLTNFYNSLETPAKHSKGVERYHKLQDSISPSKNTYEYIQEMMSNVSFSKILDTNTEDAWISDMEIADDKWNSLDQQSKESLLNQYKQEYTNSINAGSAPSNKIFWKTFYTSTYNITNLELKFIPADNNVGEIMLVIDESLGHKETNSSAWMFVVGIAVGAIVLGFVFSFLKKKRR